MRKRRRRWLWLLLLLGLVTALGAIFWPRERLLLERATPVAPTREWFYGDKFIYSLDYHWLSDHSLLFSRLSAPLGKEGEDNPVREMFQRNILTGEESKLDLLTRRLNAGQKPTLTVSPDGKWLL